MQAQANAPVNPILLSSLNKFSKSILVKLKTNNIIAIVIKKYIFFIIKINLGCYLQIILQQLPLKLLQKLQKDLGQKKFYKKLLNIDPLLINHIKSSDIQRSIRAYEVKIFTEKSIIEWYKDTKSNFKKRDFFFYLCMPSIDGK